MNKISQEDLQALRSAYDNVSNMKMELADISVTKSQIESKIVRLIDGIPVAQNNLGNIEERISKAYNAKTINLITGEFECNCETPETLGVTKKSK